MLISFFEHAYFLRALSWAIINNLWQSAFMWLLYLVIIKFYPTLSAQIKYYCSLSFLCLSFLWFVFTISTNIQQQNQLSFLATKLSPLIVKHLSDGFPIFAILYCLSLAFFAVKLFSQIVQVNFIKTNGLEMAPGFLAEFTKKVAAQFQITQPITLYLSTYIEVPSVVGFLKPFILLPIAIVNNLSEEQLQAVLIHEIAHIKRQDFLINMLQTFIELILFFNPFAKLLSSTVKRERENCCDDMVVNFNYDKHNYAKALVLLEEHRKFNLQFAMAATDDKKLLLKRIKRLFSSENHQTTLTMMQRFFMVFGCILICGIMYLCNSMLPFQIKNSGQFLTKGIDRTWIIPAKIVVETEPFSPDKVVISSSQPATITKDISKAKEVELDRNTIDNSNINRKEVSGDDGKEFVVAMVNEELLKPASKKMIAKNISRQEPDSFKTAFVSIQEQQSGTKSSKTVYLKLSNKNGKRSIEPILIINKYHTNSGNSSKTKKATYSKIAQKRRVTT